MRVMWTFVFDGMDTIQYEINSAYTEDDPLYDAVKEDEWIIYSMLDPPVKIIRVKPDREDAGLDAYVVKDKVKCYLRKDLEKEMIQRLKKGNTTSEKKE